MIAKAEHSITIPKAVAKDKHINYKDMVLEGIDVIEQAAGEKWTNYNPSDPGRNMLDIMGLV